MPFLSRAIQTVAKTRAARLATTEGGNWDLVDARTGRLISGGNRAATGEIVTPEGAYGYHAWYRAISLIAQKSAATPRLLFQKIKGKRSGVDEVDPSHTTFGLVFRRANGEQTAFQFWLQMAGHLASRGNGYAAIYRDSKGNPSEMIPLDPDHTKPYRKDGALWYVVFPFGYEGQGYKYRAKDVLHFRGFGFDGLVGYPIWQVAANEIALAQAERKLEGTQFKNAGRPSLVLQSDIKLDKKTTDRIRNEWAELQEGIDNAGKVAVLTGGLKAVPISLSPADLEQSGAAQMSITAISNYTGVPVSKLGGTPIKTTQEQEDRAFINDGLDNYLNIIDDEATAKLLSESEQVGGMFVRSDREALIRPDRKALYDMLRIATAGRAFLTPNEAREILDFPPSPEDDADKLLTPLNMGKGGFQNDPTDPADDGPGKPAKEETQQ